MPESEDVYLGFSIYEDNITRRNLNLMYHYRIGFNSTKRQVLRYPHESAHGVRIVGILKDTNNGQFGSELLIININNSGNFTFNHLEIFPIVFIENNEGIPLMQQLYQNDFYIINFMTSNSSFPLTPTNENAIAGVHGNGSQAQPTTHASETQRTVDTASQRPPVLLIIILLGVFVIVVIIALFSLLLTFVILKRHKTLRK